MNNKFTNTRLVALMFAFLFVFSIIMSGCGISKITKKAESTDSDGVINVGNGTDDVTGESQIVVGADGKSYLVDGEGNSIVYDATSVYAVNGTTAASSATKASATKGSSSNGGGTQVTETPTKGSSTDTTSSTKDAVFNAFAAQRHFGFNKAYDNLAGLANFYLDTIRCYFTYDNKYWLVEFWKGEYAWASVGCEIGVYYAEMNTLNNATFDAKGPEYLVYKSVPDEDAMYMTMELYQYKSDAAEAKHILSFSRQLCWWAAAFETGVLERHSDRTTLAMIGSIEFPTNAMRDLFVAQLEAKGFKNGDTSSYKNTERYDTDGKKVTVVWQYFKES
jgi:hypothetical protein